MLALYVVFQLFSHTKIQIKIRKQNVHPLFSANTYCEFSKAAHVKRLVKILKIVLFRLLLFAIGIRLREIVPNALSFICLTLFCKISGI